MVENSLKQRIIGAIVLIALAIIFLPAILKEKTTNGEFDSKIPKMPAILEEYQVDTQAINELANTPPSEIEQKLIQKNKNRAVQQQAHQKDIEESTKDVNASSDINSEEPLQSNLNQSANTAIAKTTNKIKKETLGKDYQDAAWVVQVASFSKESNAKKLVKKLKRRGLRAYRRAVTLKHNLLYRVFVGPYVEKVDAQRAVKKIAKISQTDAIVKAFDPIYH